jgi:hypothetical protein
VIWTIVVVIAWIVVGIIFNAARGPIESSRLSQQ